LVKYGKIREIKLARGNPKEQKNESGNNHQIKGSGWNTVDEERRSTIPVVYRNG
jgi:hypothetical protein